jgi:multiple sugar transport system ATP-binding protein
MAEPFLRVRQITKKFGSITALDRVDIEVQQDEMLVVLGPTGAGKTTLLRTIAGLESPDEGRIEMAGEDVTGWAPAARDVALVFQNFSLYPNWTVRRNLEFPLRSRALRSSLSGDESPQPGRPARTSWLRSPERGLPEEEIRRRVSWAAELLRIGDLLDRDVARLSGGQMQRVAIGRALVRQARLVLMDEPLTNLDAKLRESLRIELVCLRRRLGTPMLFVTHDQAEALSMGDRVVVISHGRILQVGAPDEVYLRPSTPEVARQLGQPRINLLRAVRREGFWVLPQGQRLCPVDGTGHDTCVVGVRPENITVEGGEFPAVVKVVQHMGPETVLLVDWLGQELHLTAPATLEIAPGVLIHPRLDPEKIMRWEGAATDVCSGLVG